MAAKKNKKTKKFRYDSPEVEELSNQFKSSLGRAASLAGAYSFMGNVTKTGRKSVNRVDILRSSVVFMHATLEELLRGVARLQLPHATAGVLDKVPFVDEGGSRTNASTKLGTFAKYRGETVDAMIAAVVDEWMSVKSFSKAKHVTSHLRICGIGCDEGSGYLGRVEEMMQRRHQIVHEADRQDVGGQGNHRARSLSIAKVLVWRDGLIELAVDVLVRLDSALTGRELGADQ